MSDFVIWAKGVVKHSSLGRHFIRPLMDHAQRRAWWRKRRPAPPPHGVKTQALQHWGDLIGADILVETGTFRGDMVRALHERFPRMISIEIVESLADRVKAEFASKPNVEIVVSDSATAIGQLVMRLNGPTVFWLDAHYSGGDTRGEGIVPIWKEIIAISERCQVDHVIVIDDAREFKGLDDGYPTLAEIVDGLRQRGYAVFVANDAIQAIPKRVVERHMK